MRIQSIGTVAASLMLILAFVFLFNFASTSRLNAQPKPFALQDEDGNFDPVDEGSKGEKTEKWDEESENGESFEEDEPYEDDEDDHEDDFEEEVEHEFMHLELEKLSVENNLVRLEFMDRLTEIAKDKEATAGYAIMHLGEFVEDEEEMIDTLEKLHESEAITNTTRNLIRMKLAEAYMHADQPEKSKGILKLMIIGKQSLEE